MVYIMITCFLQINDKPVLSTCEDDALLEEKLNSVVKVLLTEVKIQIQEQQIYFGTNQR